MTVPSLDSLAAFLTARLRNPLPGPDAQRRFASIPAPHGWAPDQQPATARRAAALILLYPGPEGVTLPLTVRRTHLPHHPGQISLPGGALAPGESPGQAALRETEEEIGVGANTVRIIGSLSTLWIPQSNFVLSPILATIAAAPDFQPHAGEVEAIVEAPLASLVDRSRLGWATRDRRGLTIDYPYFDVNGSVVWGATAMVLSEFACLFDAAFGPVANPRIT